jgi:translin
MRGHFDAQERLRERVLELSRQVIRASARAIAAMHREDEKTAKEMLNEARAGLVELKKAVKVDPLWMNSGTALSAQQEYCEAKLLEGILKQGRLPRPEELKIPYQPYLAAVADVSGELRRRALDLIRRDKVAEAERVLKTMEDLHEFLMGFDYPDAILPGMKRRQDMVRGVLEKTRGDLTTALRQQKLERALERAKQKGSR